MKNSLISWFWDSEIVKGSVVEDFFFIDVYTTNHEKAFRRKRSCIKVASKREKRDLADWAHYTTYLVIITILLFASAIDSQFFVHVYMVGII